MDRLEKEKINSQVQWKYQDEVGQFQVYEPDINYLIESARAQNKQFVDLDLQDEGHVRIDFRRMEETTLSGVQRKVHRSVLMEGLYNIRIHTWWKRL